MEEERPQRFLSLVKGDVGLARSSCSLVSWKPCSRSLEMMVRYRVISSLT